METDLSDPPRRSNTERGDHLPWVRSSLETRILMPMGLLALEVVGG